MLIKYFTFLLPSCFEDFSVSKHCYLNKLIWLLYCWNCLFRKICLWHLPWGQSHWYSKCLINAALVWIWTSSVTWSSGYQVHKAENWLPAWRGDSNTPSAFFRPRREKSALSSILHWFIFEQILNEFSSYSSPTKSKGCNKKNMLPCWLSRLLFINQLISFKAQGLWLIPNNATCSVLLFVSYPGRWTSRRRKLSGSRAVEAAERWERRGPFWFYSNTAQKSRYQTCHFDSHWGKGCWRYGSLHDRCSGTDRWLWTNEQNIKHRQFRQYNTQCINWNKT